MLIWLKKKITSLLSRVFRKSESFYSFFLSFKKIFGKINETRTKARTEKANKPQRHTPGFDKFLHWPISHAVTADQKDIRSTALGVGGWIPIKFPFNAKNINRTIPNIIIYSKKIVKCNCYFKSPEFWSIANFKLGVIFFCKYHMHLIS